LKGKKYEAEKYQQVHRIASTGIRISGDGK